MEVKQALLDFCAFFFQMLCLFNQQGVTRWMLVFVYKAFTEIDVHSNSWVHLQCRSLKALLNRFLKTVIYCLPFPLLLYSTTTDAYSYLMTSVSLLKGAHTFSNSVTVRKRREGRRMIELSLNGCGALAALEQL